jgi:uncharacterized protein with NRDE domain
MCLIVCATRVTERYPFVLAANRDERHERPTLPAAWWHDRPHVFGGRDLVAAGSWLAVDRTGRVAAVTNLPAGERPAPATHSRGALVADFVGSDRPLESMLAAAGAAGDAYGPFNLLLFHGDVLAYCSNRAPAALRFAPGIHAVGNAPLHTDWPKLRTARSGMQTALYTADPAAALFDLLATRAREAPAEGRYTSSLFITGPRYGTRSSTVILLDADGHLTFAERSFDAAGRLIGEVHERLRVAPPLPVTPASTRA